MIPIPQNNMPGKKMAHEYMSDLEWEFIKAALPNKTRGKKRVDDRRVINGIFYVRRTGIPWTDLPEQYGPPIRMDLSGLRSGLGTYLCGLSFECQGAFAT